MSAKKTENKIKMVPLARLTAKTVIGNVKAVVSDFINKNGGKAVDLDGKVATSFRVFGMVRDSAEKSKDWGNGQITTSIEFKGDFYGAIVGDETRQFRSGKMYVPGAVESMLKSELDNLPEGVNEAKFAIEIQVVCDSDSNVGYHYNVEIPLAPQANDAVKELAAAFDK